MSAEPEEVEKFYRDGSTLVAKMTGGGLGALIGTAIAGPPGAIIGGIAGPFFEHHISRAVGEVITRQLGERQRLRAAAGTLLLKGNIKQRLEAGEEPRKDSFDKFDEMGRRPFDELAEQAVLDMMNSVEERRLPYLACFYSSLFFDVDVPRASIATFVSVANSLNFRAMCIVSIVGQELIYDSRERTDGEAYTWPSVDHMVAKEVFNLIGMGVLVNQSLDATSYSATLGYMDVEPGTLKLGPIGIMIFEKMGLSGMEMNTPDLVETLQCLKRIAASPSGEPSFVKQYEAALKTFERSFELSDWVPSQDEFILSIPMNEHRHAGNPVVQVEAATGEGGFEQIMTDVRTDSEGTVQISVNKPFVGRVIIP